MKTLRIIVVVVLAFVVTSVFAGMSSVQFTYVPPTGSTYSVHGFVNNVDVTKYGIALFINVSGGWLD